MINLPEVKGPFVLIFVEESGAIKVASNLNDRGLKVALMEEGKHILFTGKQEPTQTIVPSRSIPGLNGRS